MLESAMLESAMLESAMLESAMLESAMLEAAALESAMLESAVLEQAAKEIAITADKERIVSNFFMFINSSNLYFNNFCKSRFYLILPICFCKFRVKQIENKTEYNMKN